MLEIILFYALLLPDYKITFLSISDWALVIFIIKSIIYRPVIAVRKNERFSLFLLLCGLLLSTTLNCMKNYFMISDFLQTALKFLMYILALYIVPNYLETRQIDFVKHLDYFMKVSVLGAILQKAIVMVLGRSSWPLYSLGGNWFGLTSDTTMFTNDGMMRARSFWSEPAHFAVFISMLFIILLYSAKDKLKKTTWLAYIVGIILANSFSGYGLMLMIVFIYFVNFKKRSDLIKVCFGIGVCIMALTVTLNNNTYLSNRIYNLLNLKDHSGVVRTLGGFHFLQYVPWYGVGAGNHANFYKSLSGLSSIWFSGSGEFYNNILLAIITLGYIGALGFVLLQYNILKSNKKIFISLMLTHFGWGKLYTTPIWIFLIIIITINNKINSTQEEFV